VAAGEGTQAWVCGRVLCGRSGTTSAYVERPSGWGAATRGLPRRVGRSPNRLSRRALTLAAGGLVHLL
jgi:hypothetical protein